MIFIVLGLIAGVAGIGMLSFVSSQGGPDAVVVVISGHVLTGYMLMLMGGLLVVAAALFVLSGLLKVIRRIAAIVALVFVLGGGGIAALVPNSVSTYVANHCPAQVQTLDACKPTVAGG